MRKAWSILPEEWKPILTERGLRAFRADQILQSLYRDYITDWDQATTLPKDFREALKVEFPITKAETLDVSKSADGTQKLLIGFEDGNSVETVLIPATGRFTQCISTQVGCAMGCAFCASGSRGVVRSLTADEIVAQLQAEASRGADIVKLFPAGELGLGYIKAVRGPLRHIPMSAVGGVKPENVKDYLDAGVCGFGVGGPLVLAAAVKSGDDAAIEARARLFTEAIRAWEAAR